MRIRSYCSADFEEFRDVEPPLAEFDLRHECLAGADALSQLRLGEIGRLARGNQRIDEASVNSRVKRGHFGAVIDG